MTKTQVLRLAQAKLGPRAVLRENRYAPDKSERAAAVVRLNEIRRLEKAIDAEIETLCDHWPRLIKAARFVVDVDAGPPSLPQLREAVGRTEKYHQLREQEKELKAERLGLPIRGTRWMVGVDVGIALEVKHEADTLDELVEAMIDELKDSEKTERV